MKYIQKAGSPHSYANWRTAVAGTRKADYREIPNSEKAKLLTALISEQGAICAYTMKRISPALAHIEHIKPETRCRADRVESDLDYDNLVACFPRHGMPSRYRYGAQRKDSWWDSNGAQFVSPLHPTCEHLFYFGLDGTIRAVGNSIAARTTITVLALDHDSLTEDRMRVIEEFIFGASGDAPLSTANAHRAHDNICDRNPHGSLYEFCVALRDALEQHLAMLRKLAQRGKARRTG
jgi:uncharacterized protein (TIGR02646 family)